MSLSADLQFFAATDVGRKRAHNEDNFLVDRDLCLFVVADGMGGHAAGEVASAMAVRIVHQVITSRRELLEARPSTGAPGSESSNRQVLGLLEFAVQTASARIHAEAQSDPRKRGMGTTMSLLLIIGSHAYVAHVGDSRIYMARNGVVNQITEDHTVANELLRLGMVTPDQLDKVPRKNAITRAVGVYQHAEVDTLTLEVLPQDQFLLCSDGLSGYFDETGEGLLKHLEAKDGEAVVKRLIDFANANGGKDNITSLLVRLGAGADSDSVRAKRLQLKREVLAGMPLFSRLGERELLRVMQAVEVHEYQPGQVVMREGDSGDEMFVTLTGRVRIERGQAVLGELGPGEQIGEMALIRSSPRSATVTALEPTELVSLKRGDFFDIIRTEPHVAVKLLWQFLSALAERLDRTSHDLRNAREELAAEDISSDVQSVRPQTLEDPFASPPSAVMESFRLGLAANAISEPDAVAGAVETSPPPPIEDGFATPPPGFADAPQLAERRDKAWIPEIGRPFLSVDGRSEEAPTPPRPSEPELPPTAKPGGPLPALLEELADAELGEEVPFDAKKTLVGPPRRRRIRTLESARGETLGSLGGDGPGDEALAQARTTIPDRNKQSATKPRDAATVRDPTRFKPSKETVPIDPPEALRNELDELRREFQERLRKSREQRRGGRDGE